MAVRDQLRIMPMEQLVAGYMMQDARSAMSIGECRVLASADSTMPLLVTAIEQAGEAIVITDSAARIQYANPAFTADHRLHRGRSHRPENEHAEVRAAEPGILPGSVEHDYWREIWRGELINRRKDGSCYTEKMTITPVRDPRTTPSATTSPSRRM